jgi:GNAT superfamily N-acetyltransferase
MSLRIEPIPAAATRPLRHRILRPTEPESSVVYPTDDAPEAVHFGAFVGDTLSAVASLNAEPPPDVSDPSMWRLRGMATAPEVRRKGHGAALVRACVEHVRLRGGGVIWCNARTTASPFYIAQGFDVEGEAFEMPNIGLHYRMKLVVAGAPR